MDKTLSQYAKENSISYLKAWRQHKDGKLDTYHQDGNIYIKEEKPTVSFSETEASSNWEPLSVSMGSNERRNNRSAHITPLDQYKNISDSLVPFSTGGNGYGGSSDIDVRDTVILCQKAFWNFSIVRVVVQLMVEYANSKIFFRGGSKKVREFFDSYLQSIGINQLQENFYLELFRSGNVFIYKNMGKVNSNSLSDISKLFDNVVKKDSATIPIKYTILNPADIITQGNISFSDTIYEKRLSDYELSRLKNPRTEEDKRLLESFSPEDRKKITQNRSTSVSIPLNEDQIYAIFYYKTDYESFAVPMIFPVLRDLNFKEELRRMDQALMRTINQCVLLITTGAEKDKGGINYKNIAKLQKIFDNESVGRVLISDYTTKGEFLIPDIGNIIDPKKYENVEMDIRVGLNSILIGSSSGEKFSNQTNKIQVFLNKLKYARRLFIERFLKPEIKKVAKELGFKNHPVPEYEDLEFKDATTWGRIYAQLATLGILTPAETLDALETGKIPNEEESIEAQRKLVELRQEGLYMPSNGGGAQGFAGRPAGTSAPQTTKKVTPVGETSAKYSVSKLREALIASSQLEEKLRKTLLKKHKLKKLNAQQEDVLTNIHDLIIANEDIQNWNNKIESYIESPIDKNPERVKSVMQIAEEHQLDISLASVLINSKV